MAYSAFDDKDIEPRYSREAYSTDTDGNVLRFGEPIQFTARLAERRGPALPSIPLAVQPV